MKRIILCWVHSVWKWTCLGGSMRKSWNGRRWWNELVAFLSAQITAANHRKRVCLGKQTLRSIQWPFAVASYYKEARTAQKQWVETDHVACAGKELNAAFAVNPVAGKPQWFKKHYLLNSTCATMETAIMTLNLESGNPFFCLFVLLSVCRANLLTAESVLRNKKLFSVCYPMCTAFLWNV